MPTFVPSSNRRESVRPVGLDPVAFCTKLVDMLFSAQTFNGALTRRIVLKSTRAYRNNNERQLRTPTDIRTIPRHCPTRNRTKTTFQGLSALATAVQTRLLRLVVLVKARHDSRVPAEELLRPGRLPQNDGLAERAHVVDLLLDVRSRELVVDREPITPGRVESRRMPERRVEDDHRPGFAFDRLAECSQVLACGRCELLVASGNDPGCAVRGRERIDSKKNID